MTLFLSYSRQDFQFAAGLYDDLKAAGLEPWLDIVNIPTGSIWQEEVRRAIQTCSAFVLVATPTALRSASVREEWRLALEQGKPALLVVLQSVPLDEAQTALEEITAGLENPPLQWVDVRARPLTAAGLVKQWIAGQFTPRSGVLPSPGPTWRQRWAELPRAVRTLGGIHLLAMLSSILMGLSFMLWLVSQPVFWVVFSPYRADLVSGWNSYSAFLLARAFVLAIPWAYAVMLVSIGLTELVHLPAILRRQRMRVACLGALFLILLLLVLWVFLLPFIQTYMQSAILFYDAAGSVPSFELLSRLSAGLALILAVMLYFLIDSKELKAWFPSYIGEKLRDNLPYSQNGVLATVTSQAQKVNLQAGQLVQVICAARDAPFGEALLDLLRQAKISAHLGDAQPTDGAAVLVISPWSMSDPVCQSRWQSALQAHVPLIPLLLEPFAVPNELRRLNWIDAQSDFERMRRNLLNVLGGSQLPWFKPGDLAIPGISTRQTGTMPNQIAWVMLLNGMVSPILVWVGVCLLVPAALWRMAQLDAGQWLSCGVLLLTAYLQYRMVMLFVDRRLSRHAFFAGLLTAYFLKGLCLTFFWQEVANALWVPLENLPLVLIAYETVVILLVMFPEVRRWAPAGWWMGKDKRAHLRDVWVILLVLAAGLLAPAWFGSGFEVRTQGSALAGAASLVARIPSDGGEQVWQVTAEGGSVAMVMIEPISDSMVSGIAVASGDSHPAKIFTYAGLLRAAFLATPAHHPLELHVSAPAPGGAYQLMLRQKPVSELAVRCAPSGERFDLQGNQTLLRVALSAGQTLSVQAQAANPEQSVALVLFDPQGDAVDGNLSNSERAPMALRYLAPSAGTYGVHVLTSGRYQVEISCK